MSEKEKGIDVDISVGASLKAEVKTEIPSESTGRLVDALTNIIRPFSEKRGLKADLIRLQRAKVAIEIANLAKDKIELTAKDITPVPNRVLVPLLEGASLTEEEDETLADAWSGLLASSATEINPNHGIFVDLLTKLSADHLRYLSFMASGPIPSRIEDSGDDFQPSIVKMLLRAAIDRSVGQKTDFERSDFDGEVSKVFDDMNRAGVKVHFFGFSLVVGAAGNYLGDFEYSENDEIMRQIGNGVPESLISLGLLQEEVLSDLGPDKSNTRRLNRPRAEEVYFAYHRLTSVGAQFILACNPVWWSRVSEKTKKGLFDEAPQFEVLQ